MDLATPDFLGGGVWGVVDGVAEEVEPFLGVVVGVWAERVVVDGCWGTGDLAIVGGGVEVDDVEGGLEEVDAGDEGFALDAVLVEVVGVTVGGGDEEDAVGHEGFEESVVLTVSNGCGLGEAGRCTTFGESLHLRHLCTGTRRNTAHSSPLRWKPPREVAHQSRCRTSS